MYVCMYMYLNTIFTVSYIPLYDNGICMIVDTVNCIAWAHDLANPDIHFPLWTLGIKQLRKQTVHYPVAATLLTHLREHIRQIFIVRRGIRWVLEGHCRIIFKRNVLIS